ncbi:MAG: phage integrase N-terminal SAM-like domain-containing protein [Nitrospiraceae bacterium]
MKAVSLSLSRLEGDLQMAGKATGTIQQYLSSMRGLEAFLGQEAGQATQDELRGWVDHLRRQPIGPARLRCHYSALTFLFRKTLGQPEKVAFISMPRKDAPLPIVLTEAEIQRVLEGFTSAKYRVFFGSSLNRVGNTLRVPPA